MSKRKAEVQLHERYDRSHPLLRELVRVHVDADDGASFDMLLTRVPGIGEELVPEDRCYKALRVQHEPVDNDGRARCGWHAFIEAELLPPDEPAPRPRRKSVRSTKRRSRASSGGWRGRQMLRGAS